MATNTRQLIDWEKILLDTSFIINLFLAKKGSTDPLCIFAEKLMRFLNNIGTTSGKERQYFVSSITLSEILSNETNRDLINQVLNIVNSRNVELISFDDKIAIDIANNLYDKLSKSELNKFAQEIGWKSHELMIGREWINRDYMIAMSGKNRSVDLALTTDHKTFFKVCKNISLECAVCNEEFFNTGGDNIFTYEDYKAVDKYINITTTI